MINRILNMYDRPVSFRTVLLFVVCIALTGTAYGESGQMREYLESILYTPQEVEEWISGKVLPYGKTYDSLVGYVHSDGKYRDGIDGSIVTYSHPGPRRMMLYADKPCRINTYGNSFTHCDQVNDGETWQEVLAAHLCEPVRNFGVSGISVYQAFLRMKKEETRTPANYIILNIFDDDHYRNLISWRNIDAGEVLGARSGVTYPTVPYVKVNPSTGEYMEYANPCPSRESVFQLCDANWVYETFKDDFVLKVVLARKNIRQNTPEKSYVEIMDLAHQHGMEVHIDSPEMLSQTVESLYTRAGLFATTRIVEKMEEFAAAHHKKILYVLSFGTGNVAKVMRGQRRFDYQFVEFLRERKLPYVDLLEAHLTDFATFNMSIEDYLARYWIGHYNPLGNFFTAFSFKDKLVEMLEPKPISYAAESSFYVDP